MKKKLLCILSFILCLSIVFTLVFSLNTTQMNAATDEYAQRFLDLYKDIKNTNNGYYNNQGIPYHSIETLICEAPDYGHNTTSEAFSYMLWLEAMYGKFNGDFSNFKKAWDTTEKYMIPTDADQPGQQTYNAEKPASYAPEFETPDKYPAPLDFTATTGKDPISGELKSAYGKDSVYGMHWLLDVDNWYGYGSRGDGTSTPSYINTFQRGRQESVWETVPHPSWDEFKWGGKNGFLDLFTGDKAYSKQWRYTNAPDADARAVQATYLAQKWASEKGVNIDTEVSKASKMGDYLRLSMFDKYFMKIGAQAKTPGNGYDSSHYLMSWYYAWGAGIGSAWSWRIGSSHNHFGYQNPMAAYILSADSKFKPKSANATTDWNKSLERQLEFYTWLQSSEGAIAGGATNSWNGRYEAYPSGTPTFYGMGYEENPVYHDPGSNTWFGFQAWSMQRVAQYYYETGNKTAEKLLQNWVAWIKKDNVVKFSGDDYAIPGKIGWSGKPTTFGGLPHSNANLHVTVEEYTQDVGITASLANALLYYSAGTKKHSTFDQASKDLAKKLLDVQWKKYRDSKGVSAPEKRGDYKRFFEQEVFIPQGFSGKMANGDEIKPGVKFLDIRSKYKNDKDWSKLQSAYNAGQDPEFNYHRYWAQCDVALANGTYSILFGSNPEPSVSPTITPDPVSASPVVSAVVSPSPSPNPIANLSVTATIANDWGNGATYNVTINNKTSNSKNGWEVTWTFDGNQVISNSWNSQVTQSGNKVTAKNMDWNGLVPSKGSVSFGFNISYSGTNKLPTNFIVR